VFATLPAGIEGNGVHMWNLNANDEVYDITFRDCWFEPQPRMQIEMNGRGGWWHDVTIDHCTFEPSGSQMLSFDMSPGDYTPTSPYGVRVGGVVRGVEGLRITNNDLRGTGKVVNGFTPTQWLMGIELGCVYPYAADTSVGRSEFSGNRVGRCASAWLNCDYTATEYMTFADNRFDWTYNPAGVSAHKDPPFGTGARIQNCTFAGNTWVLGKADNQPWSVCGARGGSGNTFIDEDWTKPSGSVSTCAMPFTDSTYTDCHFHLPKAVTFPASASGTGCVFDSGHSGGRFR
jgi:hypothetical protein